jgi:hypothetical protein
MQTKGIRAFAAKKTLAHSRQTIFIRAFAANNIIRAFAAKKTFAHSQQTISFAYSRQKKHSRIRGKQYSFAHSRQKKHSRIRGKQYSFAHSRQKKHSRIRGKKTFAHSRQTISFAHSRHKLKNYVTNRQKHHRPKRSVIKDRIGKSV